jgi:[methyl-Co(III) methanol-specific corrinoid protein]:coenzyme M methyltransferase
MTPKRRFLSALFGGRVDRVPAGNPTSVATLESMAATGAYFPDVHCDGEQMARLAAAGYELLGFDSIMPIFSVQQEAAALGCAMDWGSREDMPVNTDSPFREPAEVVIPGDFLERPSIAACLDAIRLLRREYGDHVAIVGKVMGPWTLSYHLNGVQQFLIDTILEPDRVRGFLKVLAPVTLLFAKAQLRAGADVICLADHATGDLVSPQCYRDFLLPVHQQLTREIGGPLILHICGDTLNRLGYIADSGFDCFHFDSKVDAVRGKAVAGHRISLVGNINNANTLLRGSPEDVRRETLYALRAGVEIVGPECAVPVRVPNINLRAIVEAAIEYTE